jgi:Zinc-uptake complex component A periplasmic
MSSQPDPHIWQNPRNAQIMAANIERALASADPTDAAAFKANLDTYAKQLQAMDIEVKRQVDSLANKKLVTNHDAFGYYTDRYGLQFIGSIPRPHCRPRPPRRSPARPGSRSSRARTPCTATHSAQPAPTATPTSRWFATTRPPSCATSAAPRPAQRATRRPCPGQSSPDWYVRRWAAADHPVN